jgi:hypothetical protein
LLASWSLGIELMRKNREIQLYLSELAAGDLEGHYAVWDCGRRFTGFVWASAADDTLPATASIAEGRKLWLFGFIVSAVEERTIVEVRLHSRLPYLLGYQGDPSRDRTPAVSQLLQLQIPVGQRHTQLVEMALKDPGSTFACPARFDLTCKSQIGQEKHDNELYFELR